MVEAPKVSVKISRELHRKLTIFGRKGQTYDDIIQELYDHWMREK